MTLLAELVGEIFEQKCAQLFANVRHDGFDNRDQSAEEGRKIQPRSRNQKQRPRQFVAARTYIGTKCCGKGIMKFHLSVYRELDLLTERFPLSTAIIALTRVEIETEFLGHLIDHVPIDAVKRLFEERVDLKFCFNFHHFFLGLDLDVFIVLDVSFGRSRHRFLVIRLSILE